MSRTLWSLSVVIVTVMTSAGTLQADSTTWDAYADFHSDQNTSSDTWQYLYSSAYNRGGDNTIAYGNFAAYAAGPGGYNVWENVSTNWHFVGKNPDKWNNGLIVHPFTTPDGEAPYISALGWKSDAARSVNVSFSVTDLDSAGGDGVAWWLFKGNDTTALSSGTIDNGGASGIIMAQNVSMAAGQMLYLQIGPRSHFGSDLTGVAFTVTAVPEPTSLLLGCCGALALLAYAWPKRR